MGNPKSQEDLWEQFLKDDGTVQKPKKVSTDGTEWTGEFDRRKKPRNEDNLASDLSDASDLSEKLGGDAANDSQIDGKPESEGDK